MNNFFRVALDVILYSTCHKSLQSLELILGDLWRRHLLYSSSFSLYWTNRSNWRRSWRPRCDQTDEPLFRHGTKCDNKKFFKKTFPLPGSSENKLIVGTVRQNRKEIPEETKLDKKDELYTSKFLFYA